MRYVVHCKLDPFDIYIGRPSCWGNIFSHKEGTLARYHVSTLEEAVQKHKEYILDHPLLVDKIKRELKGKILGCWCKTRKNPKAPCHGDTLAEIANS